MEGAYPDPQVVFRVLSRVGEGGVRSGDERGKVSGWES